MSLRDQQEAAALRARPSDLFQLEPEKPQIWEYAVSGGLAASSAYQQGSSGSSNTGKGKGKPTGTGNTKTTGKS